MALSRTRSRAMTRKSSPSCLTRVSRTSLNPENARHPLFHGHQNHPPSHSPINSTRSSNAHAPREANGHIAMSLVVFIRYCIHARSPLTHRAVCYFIPQPVGNFPYHVNSVDRREGFDGFSSLRFCGLISGQNRCIFGFPPKMHLSIFFFHYNLLFQMRTRKKMNFPRNCFFYCRFYCTIVIYQI